MYAIHYIMFILSSIWKLNKIFEKSIYEQTVICANICLILRAHTVQFKKQEQNGNIITISTNMLIDLTFGCIERERINCLRPCEVKGSHLLLFIVVQ